MTKINVTDVVTDNAMCSTINDMDIDVAADVSNVVALTWLMAWQLAGNVSFAAQF